MKHARAPHRYPLSEPVRSTRSRAYDGLQACQVAQRRRMGRLEDGERLCTPTLCAVFAAAVFLSWMASLSAL